MSWQLGDRVWYEPSEGVRFAGIVLAQFEREMIGERTRDKIAASRRKGKWTGGPVPLGYQVEDKKLVVDELEVVVARELFDPLGARK